MSSIDGVDESAKRDIADARPELLIRGRFARRLQERSWHQPLNLGSKPLALYHNPDPDGTPQTPREIFNPYLELTHLYPTRPSPYEFRCEACLYRHGLLTSLCATSEASMSRCQPREWLACEFLVKILPLAPSRLLVSSKQASTQCTINRDYGISQRPRHSLCNASDLWCGEDMSNGPLNSPNVSKAVIGFANMSRPPTTPKSSAPVIGI